jgi:hypothetical protein
LILPPCLEQATRGRDIPEEGQPPRAGIGKKAGPESMKRVAIGQRGFDQKRIVNMLEGLLEVNQ